MYFACEEIQKLGNKIGAVHGFEVLQTQSWGVLITAMLLKLANMVKYVYTYVCIWEGI
jgi:hypothetical protein